MNADAGLVSTLGPQVLRNKCIAEAANDAEVLHSSQEGNGDHVPFFVRRGIVLAKSQTIEHMYKSANAERPHCKRPSRIFANCLSPFPHSADRALSNAVLPLRIRHRKFMADAQSLAPFANIRTDVHTLTIRA